MTSEAHAPANQIAQFAASLAKRGRKFLKTPKGYALFGLILVTLVAGLTPEGAGGIGHAAVAVAAGLAVDAGVARALKRRVTFSTGAVITALIVAGVLSNVAPLYVVVLTTAAALASKHVVKRGRKPVFNPAAVGLLLAVVAFSAPESWWTSMPLMPVWALLLMMAVGVFVSVRVQKYPQVLMFLAVYFGLVLVMALGHLGLASATPADALRPPFVNSALFLSFFMLTDPPTTPATPAGQLQFGAVAAVVAVMMFMLVGGLTYLLVGLLAGNLWTLVLAHQRSWRATAPRPAQPAAAAEGSRLLWIMGWAGALVAVGALTAVLVLNSRTATPPPAPLASSALLVGQWSGTVHATAGTNGGTMLELTGTWRGSALALSLTGLSQGGEFVIQGGQVRLTTARGATWQGSISGGGAQNLTALLRQAGGGGAAITLTIQVPTVTAGGQFVSQVSARTAS